MREIKMINKIKEADEEICGIPLRLRTLADAFLITGNSVVSDELHRIANRVAFYRNDMKKAVSKLIDETTSQK